MRDYILEREQWIPRRVEELFAFFSDARNLEAITPPWLRFRILTPGPIPIAVGTHISYRLSWHGIPVKWTTEITQWEPPSRFIDMQLRGPYQLWHHTHSFEPLKDGTLMKDVVRYRLPFGFVGRLAHAIRVRRDVERIFDYRFQTVKELFPPKPVSY